MVNNDRSAADTRCLPPVPREVRPMPQLQLPFFPDGVTHITNQLAFRRQAARSLFQRP
jgi:hypothetical protein